MSSKYYDIIIRPIITEKSMGIADNIQKSRDNLTKRNPMKKSGEILNTYVFEVAKTANKIEIKKAVETAFKVSVVKVTTVHVLPKYKKVGQHEGLKPAYKKAYVTLSQGDKIDKFVI